MMKLITEIKEPNWKPLIEAKDIEQETPYWLKLKNGNVVLAAFIVTAHAHGWGQIDWNTKTISGIPFLL